LQSAILATPPLDRLIGGMQEIVSDRVAPDAELDLPILFGEIYDRDPSFALSLFLDPDNRDRYESLCRIREYQGVVIRSAVGARKLLFGDDFPLKSFLWHMGILIIKG